MGLSLVHRIHRVHGADPTGSRPLLVLLHGIGSNEDDLIGLAPHLDPRFLVVSARAPMPLGPHSYGWFDLAFTLAGRLVGNMQQAEASRQILLGFLAELSETYGTDPGRAYLMGFSQGAIISLYLALTEPERVAGVVAMSGYLPEEVLPLMAAPERLKGLPLLVVHGTEDPVLTIEQGRAARDHLQALPVDLTYREYAMAHQVSPESLADVARWLQAQLGF